MPSTPARDRQDEAEPERAGSPRCSLVLPVSMERAESRKRKREEYEMQLFSFHSRAVYATLKSLIMERIQSKCRKLCKTLENRYKLESENLVILKTNEQQLVKAYHTAVLPNLKNIENIVNKFIAVPPNILSDEDKLQKRQYTDAELKSIRKKLDNLQERAKRATILSAALKEELQLIEQFSINADNTDKLSHVIENDVAYPNVSNKTRQLVEDYKKFSLSLSDGAPVLQKSLYNTTDNLKCIDFNVNSLDKEKESL